MNIGGNSDLYVGEDKNLDLEVLDADDVPVNISSLTIVFDIRRKPHAAVAMVTVTCSTEGSYNSDRDTNTQRARAALTDDQTSKILPGTYWGSFKVTTAGAETILWAGQVIFEEATQK